MSEACKGGSEKGLHDAARQFLLGRIDYERSAAMPYDARAMRLDRMRHLLRELGDPQDRLPIVHIAGTKGKGSTAAMAAAILAAAGYRTGLYHSPHLDRVEERLIVCDGRHASSQHPRCSAAAGAIDRRQTCPADEFIELVEQVRPIAEAMDRSATDASMSPTFFELTTAIALLHFVRRAVEVAVLEVGLGGRLDSTNVCLPRVTVITNISFDHTQQLGKTLAKIAREKAGIIKPGVPVISGVLDDEPRQVIEAAATAAGSPLRQLGVDFDYVYRPPARARGPARDERHEPDDPASNVQRPTSNVQQFDSAVEHSTPQVDAFDVGRWTFDVGRSALSEGPRRGRADVRLRKPPIAYDGLELGLLGRHQAANAALAIAALAELQAQGWQIPEEAVRRGLAGVRWPARIEVVHQRPTVVLDAAHNLASIAALAETLDESFAPRRRVLIFGASSDKDVRGMLALVTPRFDEVIFTRYVNNPRGVPPEELARLAPNLARAATVCADPSEAWDAAGRLLLPGDLLCITGSFFLAAEMRAEMARRPLAADPAVPPVRGTAPASIASEKELPSETPILR